MSKRKPGRVKPAVIERGIEMNTQRSSEEILAEVRLEDGERKRLIDRLVLTSVERDKLTARIDLTEEESDRLAVRLDLTTDERKRLAGHLELTAQEKMQLAARKDLTPEERERLEGPLDLTQPEEANKQREAAARMESQVSTATQMAYDLIIGGCERNKAIDQAADWASRNAPDILTKEDAVDKIRTRLE